MTSDNLLNSLSTKHKNVPDQELHKLEQDLGYIFKDISHLRLATTHSSFDHLDNYERYEFLGDSIVNFVIGKYLFNNINNVTEGELTKMRAVLICGPSLCVIANKLNLGYYIRFAKGEIQNNGRNRDSIMEDVVEATIAAIYLDSGSFEVTEKVVLNLFKDLLNQPEEYSRASKDPKTYLQELVQDLYKKLPDYEIIRTEGKAHNQIFYVECTVRELQLTTNGSGSSKRKAEQEAATKMIKEITKREEVINQLNANLISH